MKLTMSFKKNTLLHECKKKNGGKESLFQGQYSLKGPQNKVQNACSSTLESGIDVGQPINVGPGIFGKKNKHRALNTHVLCSK